METLILLIKPIPGSKGFFLKNILALLAHVWLSQAFQKFQNFKNFKTQKTQN
ncbi:hypothetical protein HMPREF1450_00496 [Helicobacter pylori HP260ASii]|nr:hypothetical protein HMPREF1450_00496 [Helicobacter pylori HP260ASii]